MFYEVKEKRVKTSTQTKWWLTAAFSGVAITATFIGIIFWLGITVRQSTEYGNDQQQQQQQHQQQQQQQHRDRHPSSYRDHQQYKSWNNKPMSASSQTRLHSQPEYPAAEILKTTIKNKKGRIELVDNGGEKFVANAAVDEKNHSNRDSGDSPSSSSFSGGEFETNSNVGGKHLENEDTPSDVQLRSKIAKLSFVSAQRTNFKNGGDQHLGHGIDPLEEIASVSRNEGIGVDYDDDGSSRNRSRSRSSSSSSSSSGSSNSSGSGSDDMDGISESNSSVKKKSEAILPSWYDTNLQNYSPKLESPVNDLKSDTIYELPNFSQIKPDLSAFNTKTIPAFTYLKEPLPEFERVTVAHAAADASAAAADIAADSAPVNMVDDSFYYQKQQPTNYLLNPAAFVSAASSYFKDDNSLTNYLQKRLQNVHDWLIYGNKKNRTVDVMDMVKMVNNSFQTKNVGLIFSKLKDLYAGFNTSDVQNMPVANLLYPTSPSILNNSTSLVSFGLLAIDLFLLHNVQQIVWNEESKIGEEMLKDPDVVALNALFMSPDRVQQLRQTNSRIFTDDDDDDEDDDDADADKNNHHNSNNQNGGGDGNNDRIIEDGRNRSRKKKSVVHDLLEFINGGLRAVLNLSKAYKNSVSRSTARSTSNGSALDCIWTLYCRNLDKTAKLQGPYGFLAKMNSLGLRLMMGEFPVEKALDRLIKEYNNGWGTLDCNKLFPRCNAEEAKEIVMQTALSRSSY